nr:hypothetical protein REQ54_02308 [Rhizobium sp. Q54]
MDPTAYPKGGPETEKGRVGGPSMSLVRLTNPDAERASAGRCVQAEGCPVKTITFPKSETQTEISLDIGSPSFHYVDDEQKVGMASHVCKARYVTMFGYN